MRRAARALFRAVRIAASDELKSCLRISFVGTSYADRGKGQPTFVPIAAEEGVADIVSENTDRVSYSDALRLLKESDALFVPASEDPAYTASKIFPYLLAKKPTLVVCRRGSELAALLDRVGGATSVFFDEGESDDETAERVANEWIREHRYAAPGTFDNTAIERYSEKQSASELARFFDACLSK